MLKKPFLFWFFFRPELSWQCENTMGGPLKLYMWNLNCLHLSCQNKTLYRSQALKFCFAKTLGPIHLKLAMCNKDNMKIININFLRNLINLSNYFDLWFTSCHNLKSENSKASSGCLICKSSFSLWPGWNSPNWLQYLLDLRSCKLSLPWFQGVKYFLVYLIELCSTALR